MASGKWHQDVKIQFFPTFCTLLDTSRVPHFWDSNPWIFFVQNRVKFLPDISGSNSWFKIFQAFRFEVPSKLHVGRDLCSKW